MYAIARRLSLEARRETAAFFAEACEGFPRRVRVGCYCPLGYALETMGTPATVRYARTDSRTVASPNSHQIAQALLGTVEAQECPEGYHETYLAAQRFIHDWDSGEIRDIYTALGVRKPKKEQAPPCSPTESTPTPDPAP